MKTRWITVIILLLLSLCLTVNAMAEAGGSKGAPNATTNNSAETEVQEEPEEPALAIRSTVVFGSYEQDGDKKNGKEPLEWVVLDVQDGKALLLTSKIIDYPENSMNAKIVWNKSKIRNWCNETFYKVAFDKAEQKAILTTEVHTPENPYFLRGGCDTKDKVFCLSMDEVLHYFEHRGEIGQEFIDILDPIANPEVTPVAKTKAVKRGDITAFDEHLSWWLRDTGYEYDMAIIYNDNILGGSMLSFYGCYYEGIRPAVWVEIDKLPR